MAYNGAGIYGIYNVLENRIYIGKSNNISARLSQHKAKFAEKSGTNEMYSEPIENFVTFVLRKMTEEEYIEFGDLLETLLIIDAERHSLNPYNKQKKNSDPYTTMMFRFRVYGKIEEAIRDATGQFVFRVEQMEPHYRAAVVQKMKSPKEWEWIENV